jgi:hypothetical protein
MTARIILFGNIFTSWQAVTVPILFTGLGCSLIFTKRKPVAGAVLCVLLLLYGAFRFLF